MGPKTSGPVNTKGSVTLHPGMTREHSRVQVLQKEKIVTEVDFPLISLCLESMNNK